MCDSRGMTTAGIRTLENEIERLVREHIAACKAAAEAAVERGFGSTRTGRAGSTRRRASKSSKASRPRRTPEQIAELGERFYAAVCAKPGETMRVLSAEVGASPDKLHRPMTVLKRAGRVRSVGQRHQTRYFPMVSESSGTR